MQSKKENETLGIALYNSDTDDWTLVSPPASSSGSSPESSPDRNSSGALQQLPPLVLTEAKQLNATAQVPPDNTTQSSSSRKEVPIKKQTSHKASTKLVLDGANISERANDADDESDGMTEVNLDENGIATIRGDQVSVKQEEASSDEDDWTDDDDDEDEQGSERDEYRTKIQGFNHMRSIRTITQLALDLRNRRAMNECQVSEVATNEHNNNNDRSRPEEQGENNTGNWFEPFFLSFLLACSLIIIISSILPPKHVAQNNSPYDSKAHSRTPKRLFNNTFDFLYSDPSNHAYTELKILNEELVDCIERENPVMRELAHWRSMSSKELSKYKTITNTRPFKGLVCYENEVKWRKRFNYLKTEFNFDMRKIVRQIKRRLTNDILVNYHPQTPFELVLNQLEYLDHVEQRRKDRALEKLKAENLDLLRRLNNGSDQERNSGKSQHKQQRQQQQQQRDTNGDRDHSTMKSLIILESENVRLRREVESLKSRLAEKAGTVYIKQSIELEKCERENSILKQFHQDVTDEVGRNLRKVGLHQTEELFTHMTTNAKDDDSTSAKLDSTRHLFMKLGEEITKILARNKDLEKDLTESKMLNALVTREAQNLIRDVANRTKQPSEKRVKRIRPTIWYPHDSMGVRQKQQQASKTEKMATTNQLDVTPTEHLDKGADDPAREKHLLDLEDSATDWLSKRAQLREQLRESSRALERHLSDLKQVPRSISSSSEQEHNNGRYHQEHSQPRVRNNDAALKHLESLKKLNKPNKSSWSVNYYNQNSHKNCKNHHKRDEL